MSQRPLARAMLVFGLLAILLVLPLRSQKYIWYARNANCIPCHQSVAAKYENNYGHAPFVKQQCTVCHKPHDLPKARIAKAENRSFWGNWFEKALPKPVKERLWNMLLPVTQSVVLGAKESALAQGSLSAEKLCVKCHANLTKTMGQKSTHPPFKQKQCLTCHDPHASNYSSMMRRRPDVICTLCHRKTVNAARRVKHRPFELRSCTSCHSAHASAQTRLLKAEEKNVCLECHQDVAKQMSLPVKHPPFEQGNCVACHQPHSSDQDFVLQKVMPEVCYGCHYTVRADFERTSHHPIGPDFTCVKCHSPHASENRVLLAAQGNQLCFQCHADVQSAFEARGHSKISPSQEGQATCLACHKQHGSPEKPLLIMDSVSLCRSCHSTQATGMKHPVGEGKIDPRQGFELTCISTCHWVHYVDEPAFLKWKPDELCLSCHPQVGETK